MSNDAIVFAGLMPHAPVLVPSVAKELHAQVRRTLSALANAARHALAARPDTVLLISPHAPRSPHAFGLWQTPQLRGSFEQFGSDEDHVDLPLDRAFTDRLENEASRRGLPTWRISGKALDHGAAVPLAYLSAAGWTGPTVVVSLNQPGGGGLEEFGQAIAVTAEALGRRLAVIASGDLSHRLTASAPGGFHADGSRFDHTFIELLQSGTPGELRHLDPVLRDHASEDAVDSTRVALAAAGNTTPGRTVLSYEGPFGVGYGVAILFEDQATDPMVTAATAVHPMLSHPADLPRVARCAVLAQLNHDPDTPPFTAAGALATPRPVFVTLRRLNDQLRGCQGSETSTRCDLVQETWHQARRAAFEDSRFPPLRAEDLSRVRFSVSLLGPLEPVTSLAELNPARHGILVTGSGGHHALLLPALKGIDTPAEQLRAAKHKAGLRPEDTVDIRRFTTQTFQEPLPVDDRD